MGSSQVKDVMTTHVLCVGPDTGYRDIAEILISNNVSAVPVVDEQRHVLGVVSEADLMAKIELGSAWPAAAKLTSRRRRTEHKAAGDVARDLMSKPAATISPQNSIAAAARKMADEHVRRLPVVDRDDRLVGIVARHDLLAAQLRTDPQIRMAVMALLSDWFQAQPPAVTANVQDGIVTLSGEMEHARQVPLAAQLTRTLEGVVDVDNQLTFRIDDRSLLHR